MSPVLSPKSLLLCPRGTSLASLILSSKFMQDKCYPDRACAELSGLPREICTGEAVKLAPMGLKIACSAVHLSGAIARRSHSANSKFRGYPDTSAQSVFRVCKTARRCWRWNGSLAYLTSCRLLLGIKVISVSLLADQRWSHIFRCDRDCV